jgi:hypothetical protein
MAAAKIMAKIINNGWRQWSRNESVMAKISMSMKAIMA